MTAAARTKAERCFALARSTKFDGERDNAIAQGTRIAEGAGLSLDLFDIPGRARKAAPKPEARGQRGPDMGAASYSSFHEFGGRGFSRGFGFDTTGTADDLSNAFRMMAEQMRREKQRARERMAERVKETLAAMEYLTAQGAIIHRDNSGSTRWRVVVGKMPPHPMTDGDLVRFADDVRLATEARDRKRAYEAGRHPERCARCGSIITIGVRHECPSMAPCARCGGYELHSEGCPTLRTNRP